MNTIELAQNWRQENGYDGRGGVVVVFDDIVQGWVNELRNPEHWQPGCVAVDAQGCAFVAHGGNERDGARRWDMEAGAGVEPAT